MAMLHISQFLCVMHNLCGTRSEVAVHLILICIYLYMAIYLFFRPIQHLERFLSNETSIRIDHVGSTSLQSVLAVLVAGAQSANLGKVFKFGHTILQVILEPFKEVLYVMVILKCPVTLAEEGDSEHKKRKHHCTLQGTRLSVKSCMELEAFELMLYLK